eukprot:scaffold18601_cov63-Phaeocystis_antarctica.AAC.6
MAKPPGARLLGPANANLIFVLHTGQMFFLRSTIHSLRHTSQHQCMHGWMLYQAIELCVK